ncbi:MFS transporter [Spirillospora sp. CA-294931]|uniref:MFS transporter n=1 Tax=Spirillospora sp. CA-294931 TaxID=3240042 RepID=UPI003D917C58
MERTAPRPPPAVDPLRYRWVILGVATFTQAATAFFVQGIGAMGVHLQRDLDISTAQLGLLLSAAQFAPLLGFLVAGELLDRYNERWIVGTGATVVAAGLLLGSTAPGYASLLLVLLLVGAGYSTIQPGGTKSVASWFDPSRRGFAMGIRQAGLPLGAALSSAALPFLAGATSWRATLLAGGLVALLGAAVFMVFYRRPPHVTVPEDGPHLSLGAQLAARFGMVREPSMRKVLLSGLSLISVQCGVGILTVLYLYEKASLEAGAATLVLVASLGAGVAGRIVLAAWSDRVASRYTCVMTCMIAVIAGMAVLMTPLGREPVPASLTFVWLGFFGLGWYGPWLAYLTESAPPGKVGFALGMVMAVNQIAIVLVPPTLGLLKDLTGSYTPAWAVLTALTLATLAATAPAVAAVVSRQGLRRRPPYS